MKIRKGFVSNSSSSSFVVAKSRMTDEQINALETYCLLPIGPYNDSWTITVDEHYVKGFTCMNNNTDEPGGLEDWFAKNNIVGIKWEHD